MNTFITLCFIQMILVIITDYSGFPEDFIKPLLKKVFKTVGEPSKIFTCSFCQMVWVGLAYLLFSGQFLLPYIFDVFILAVLTPFSLNLVWFVKDLFDGIISLLRAFSGLN